MYDPRLPLGNLSGTTNDRNRDSAEMAAPNDQPSRATGDQVDNNNQGNANDSPPATPEATFGYLLEGLEGMY